MQELSKTNFADQAEKVVQSMIETDRKGNPTIRLTTSKIRNLLSMTNVLYNHARQKGDETLNEDLLRDIQYLKMRFAYESGREPEVKKFVDKAEIKEHIQAIGKSREKLLLFCNYIESLVAYHRYYGGKDR